MNQSIPKELISEIEQVERALQQLKLKVYRSTGKIPQSSRYAERALFQTAKDARDTIWQERYAKKITRLS